MSCPKVLIRSITSATVRGASATSSSPHAKSGVAISDKVSKEHHPCRPEWVHQKVRSKLRPTHARSHRTNTTMPPPATKRRKLEQSEDESEGSFADFGEVASAGSEAGEDAHGDDSDVSMDGPADAEDVSDDEDAEESVAQKNKKTAPAASATPAQKAPKRPAATLQEGAYTSESFKSNMFKLQVDELLEQVKPKYGKKEALAENAMRTLKTIIESIPTRDALPVRIPAH
jgi:hypothetical protein